MNDRTIVSFDPSSAFGRVRTYISTARIPILDVCPRNVVVAAASIVCLGFALVLSVLYIPRLAGGISAVEGFVVFGLLAGHVLAFFLGWVYANTRAAEDFSTGPHTLSKNVTFTVLKNRRRRDILRYLRRTEGTAGLGELAEYIAAKENDIQTNELTSYQRKRVYTTLYQCHLPMMEEAGIVEYDQNRGSVELLDVASELFAYIDNPHECGAEA